MDLWSSLKSVGFVGSEIWGALRLSGRGHIQDHPGAWAGAPALRTGPQGSPCSSSEPTLSTRQTHQAKAMPTHWLCGALLSPQGLDIRVWSSHSQLLEPPRASARPPLPGQMNLQVANSLAVARRYSLQGCGKRAGVSARRILLGSGRAGLPRG